MERKDTTMKNIKQAEKNFPSKLIDKNRRQIEQR